MNSNDGTFKLSTGTLSGEDETEGHGFKGTFSDQDETEAEGHGISSGRASRWGVTEDDATSDGDDAEGHAGGPMTSNDRSIKLSTGSLGGEDEMEGHGFKGPFTDQDETEVEGHGISANRVAGSKHLTGEAEAEGDDAEGHSASGRF